MNRRPRILVDLVHAHENNPEDYRHNKRDYEYYNSYSVFRVFRHLDEHGYPHVCHRLGPLTPGLLAQFDLLFINLMHEHAPAFEADEIRAVHAWIEAGGSLLCIGEHTNAYLSADRINPLIAPLGLSMRKTTALETDPRYATMAPGWILVRHFDTSHPVCAGVSTLHFMSGGTVGIEPSPLRDSSGRAPQARGIAFTSPTAWADNAGPHAPAYFGDGVRSDGDETGSLPVCGVSEFGRGRVLVVGDQNCWGDAWLGMRHNLRFALNAVEWLTQTPPGSSAASGPLRNTRPHGLVAGIDTRFRPFSVAKEYADDYFAFFNNWSRDGDATALGIALGEDDEHLRDVDVLVIPSPTQPVDEDALARIRDQAAKGRAVVLLLDIADVSPHAIDLLHALAPDFMFEVEGHRQTLGALTPDERRELPQWLRQAGTHAPSLPGAPRLLSHDPALPTDAIDLHGYAFARVRSPWGTPLLQAQTAGAARDCALACPTVQSSDADPERFAATCATDGNSFTSSATHESDGAPWLCVDLMRPVPVAGIVLVAGIEYGPRGLADVEVALFAQSPVDFTARSRTAAKALFRSHRLGADESATAHLHVSAPGIEARYVLVSRVTSSEQRPLAIGMVRVFAAAGHEPAHRLFDVASGASARQSSTAGPGNEAGNALDPSPATRTHTALHDDRAFWQVDLGRAVNVRLVAIKNRRDDFSHFFRDLTVVLSEDAAARHVAFRSPVINPSHALRDLPQASVHLQGGVRARYVTVFRRPATDPHAGDAERHVLSLVHVQVLADADANEDAAPADGEIVDIARVGRIAGLPASGPLVVFLQDGFFRNRFLGVQIDRRPHPQGEAATALQYALIDWLKTR